MRIMYFLFKHLCSNIIRLRHIYLNKYVNKILPDIKL